MSRGVSFERVLEFFDTAPLRVAQAAVSAGLNIVGKREADEERSAKSQTSRALPVARRARRTKAQIAAAKANAANGNDTVSPSLADA